MTELKSASGVDLARQALAAYKATAKTAPAPQPKRRRTRRADRGAGRDPILLGAALGTINAEQGWGVGLTAGNIIDQWATLCPQYADHVQPAAYDQDRGRLDLRPTSHAYAAQLRLLGGQLCKQINDKLGRDAVRSIRVLPVGGTPAGPAPVATVEATAPAPAGPIRTRETASPGYRKALESALAHRPGTGATNPHIVAAVRRQDHCLADPARREPPEAFTDAVAAHEALTAKAPVDSLDASIRAALARKHRGDQPVRRAFDVA